jgi:hypothetical protein
VCLLRGTYWIYIIQVNLSRPRVRVQIMFNVLARTESDKRHIQTVLHAPATPGHTQPVQHTHRTLGNPTDLKTYVYRGGERLHRKHVRRLLQTGLHPTPHTHEGVFSLVTMEIWFSYRLWDESGRDLTESAQLPWNTNVTLTHKHLRLWTWHHWWPRTVRNKITARLSLSQVHSGGQLVKWWSIQAYVRRKVAAPYILS